MSTQRNKAESSNEQRPQSTSSKEMWDIQVAEGQILYQLKIPTIVRGLREGWITLDDSARKAGEITWSPIRESLAKVYNQVAVFLDPPGVYAREYGSNGGMLVAFLLIFGGWLYSGVTLFDLTLGRAFGFAIAMLIAIMGLTRGNILFVLIGLAAAAGLVGFELTNFLNLPFLIGLAIGTALTGLVGYAIGYGPGYVIGRLVGSRHRGRYQLPTVRRPVPDEVEREFSQQEPKSV